MSSASSRRPAGQLAQPTPQRQFTALVHYPFPFLIPKTQWGERNGQGSGQLAPVQLHTAESQRTLLRVILVIWFSFSASLSLSVFASVLKGVVWAPAQLSPSQQKRHVWGSREARCFVVAPGASASRCHGTSFALYKADNIFCFVSELNLRYSLFSGIVQHLVLLLLPLSRARFINFGEKYFPLFQGHLSSFLPFTDLLHLRRCSLALRAAVSGTHSYRSRLAAARLLRRVAEGGSRRREGLEEPLGRWRV